MLLTVLAAWAQPALPTAAGPLLLPARTTNLSRGEAVAVDALFRAHLQLALGAPLYPPDATRELALQTGSLADPLAACRAVACPRLMTVEVVRLGDALHVEVIDRDPDGRVRLDLSAATTDLDGLAPLARDLGPALATGAPTGAWTLAMPTTDLPLRRERRRAPADPHVTSTYGVVLGAAVVGIAGDTVGTPRFGYEQHIERERWYLHGDAILAVDSFVELSYMALELDFGGGWNGSGAKVAPQLGGGASFGLYAHDGGAVALGAYGEGGAAFLRDTTSRVYVTGRLGASYDLVGREPIWMVSLNVGAGF